MSMKEELIQWNNGCLSFEEKDYYGALAQFEPVADTSKLHFNMAAAYGNLRMVDEQIGCLTRAISCDVYMAVSYFQRGACFLQKNMLPEALADFTDALAFLRGNLLIDYTQLGLAYKLYACEVSYNRGLCFAAVGQIEAAVADFDDAMRTRPMDNKSTDYRRLEEAMELRGRAADYCRPFEVPGNLIFKPPAAKIKNAEKVNYLGKSKVVAAVDETDSFAGFSGTKLKAETLSRNRTPLENDNTFGSSVTLGRGPTVRKGSQGLDGTPMTYASLSRRAESATTSNMARIGDSNGTSGGSPGRKVDSPPQSSSQRERPSRKMSEGPNITQRRYDDDSFASRRDRRPSEPALRITAQAERSRYDEDYAARDRDMARDRDHDRDRDRDRDRDDRNGGGSRGRDYDGERERDASRSRGREGANNGGSRAGRSSSRGNTNGNGGGREDDDYDSYRNPGGELTRRNTTMSMGSSSIGDKLKIKCHYTDTRILLVPINVTFEDLSARIQKKFAAAKPLKLKYKDVDQELVLMTDQEDMEVAFEMAGIEYGVAGAGDRFEIWCFL